MVAEHTFHTGTVELNYAEGEASGPPIVLLHGGSLRWQSVMLLIRDLAARWHVYAPDLRGHGRSGRVPGRYRLQDYASDVALFLEQVVNAPAILVGHSLGGHVAILVAALHRVRPALSADHVPCADHPGQPGAGRHADR